MTLDQVKNLLKAAGPDVKVTEDSRSCLWWLDILERREPIDAKLQEYQIKETALQMCSSGYRNSIELSKDGKEERYLKIAHRLLTSWLRGPK